MSVTALEVDELSERAPVDSGAKRGGPQAGDTGFGNPVEICRDGAQPLQQNFVEQEHVRAPWCVGPMTATGALREEGMAPGAGTRVDAPPAQSHPEGWGKAGWETPLLGD